MQRHRRGKMRRLDELHRVDQRNRACAVGERSHFGAADHHAVGGKASGHRRLRECAREPALAQVLIRTRCGVPDLDRAEMRQVRLRVADALHDRQLLALPKRHQRLQRRMQRGALVELNRLLTFDADVFAQLIVSRIGKRNHGVQTVVTALQFDENQQVAVAATHWPALGRRLRAEGAWQPERRAGGCAHREKAASFHPAPRSIVMARGLPPSTDHLYALLIQVKRLSGSIPPLVPVTHFN